jgi:uncharacterized membrane protein
MVGGAVISIVMIAAGAILDFAVVESPYQHGFDINTVGVILMVVGGAGLFLSLLFGLLGSLGYRRHRTVVDDGRGNVVRRDDSYI